MKPRLVKSLIAQNAALLREKQQLLDYLKAVEMVLRTITKNGKDSGVVDLKQLHSMCREMKTILSSYEINTFQKMGTLRAPTKRDLGKTAQADEQIMHGFFQGSAEEMREFFDKMIDDIMKKTKDGEGMWVFPPQSPNNPPISPDKFGADLEGEWQDGLPPDDPFGETDLDKPE